MFFSCVCIHIYAFIVSVYMMSAKKYSSSEEYFEIFNELVEKSTKEAKIKEGPKKVQSISTLDMRINT